MGAPVTAGRDWVQPLVVTAPGDTYAGGSVNYPTRPRGVGQTNVTTGMSAGYATSADLLSFNSIITAGRDMGGSVAQGAQVDTFFGDMLRADRGGIGALAVVNIGRDLVGHITTDLPGGQQYARMNDMNVTAAAGINGNSLDWGAIAGYYVPAGGLSGFINVQNDIRNTGVIDIDRVISGYINVRRDFAGQSWTRRPDATPPSTWPSPQQRDG